MKTIHKLLSLLIFCISTTMYSQTDVTIQTVVTPPYQLRLEEYTNSPENIVLNVTNNTSRELEIKFLATLIGDNGVSITTVGQPPVPYVLAPNNTQALTGIDIDNMYLQFSESDFNIAGASPEARSQIINNRVLPEGSYQLCIQALEYTTARRLSDNKIGCTNFEIIHPERPIITTPFTEEELIVNTPSVVNFSWTQPVNASAELLSRLQYTLRVVDLTEHQVLGISSQEALLNPNSDFIVHEQNIKANVFTAFDANFIANRKYAVMVIAEDEAGEIPMAYNGQSEIVEFYYGKADQPLKSIRLASVYPLDGDVLPFRKVTCIVEADPDTPVSDRENYTRMTLHQMSIDEEGRNVYTREADDVNNWGRRGLVTYMENQLGEPLSPRYYQFWVNKTEDFQEHNRGKEHSWTAEMSFNDEVETKYRTSGNFTSGMTAPVPELPENRAVVAPGEIAFKFATGTMPRQLLPYYDIYRLNTRLISNVSDAEKRNLNAEKELIKVGKSKPRNKEKDKFNQGSQPVSTSVSTSTSNSTPTYTSVTDLGTAFYEVYERYVFQISKDENFRSVIYTLSEPIIVDADEMPTDFKNSAQRQEYAEKIYRDDHAVSTINEEGTYYWRIVYLNDPAELTEEQYRTITPKQYYQTSEIFSFTIGSEDSNAVAITSPSDGSSLTSEPKPKFVWRLPNIEDKDNATLTGRLAIIDVTHLTEEDEITPNDFDESNGSVKYLDFTGGTISWTYDDTTENPNITNPAEASKRIFLQPNNRYAVMVKVRYPDGTDGIHNNGNSNIVKFRYLNATPETTDCRADIVFAVSSETAVDLGAITDFTAGHFLVKNLRNVTNSSGTYSGEGVIQIPTLGNIPIAVEFSNIRLNAGKELISGEVTGKRNTAYAGIFPTMGTENGVQELTSNGTLNTWLESLGTQDITNPTSISLPLKFEPEIGGKKAMFGITGLKLQKNIAHISMGHEIHIGSFAGADDQWFGTAFTIALTPNGFGFEDVEIGPSRDLQIGAGAGADWAFVLKPQRNEGGITRGTHMKLTCGGIERFEIDAEVHFPTKILVKNMPDGSQGADNDPVKGKFNFAYVKGASTPNPDRVSSTDIMVVFTMDEFQVKGVEGWGFRLDEGYIDLSALENPEGMVFPENYQHFATSIPDGANAEQISSITNSWKGFYLKEMAIQAPKDFYKAAGDRQFTTGVRNLIIDGTGFSANFITENIIDINKGQVEKFAFSLDRVEIRILQNAFLSGSLNGKFAIPISKNTERGRVDYEAILAYTIPQVDGEDTLAEREWGFFMNVQTNNDIVVPIPALMAEATLAENSYVRVRLGEGSIPDDQTNVDVSTVPENSLSLYLNGNMNISSENTESGDRSTLSDIATAINFEGIDFELKYNSATGIDNAHSRIAFASPQKVMGASNATNESGAGGFDVSITNVTFDSTINFDEILNKNFCTDISVELDLSVSLMASSGGGFEASTKLTFNAKFLDNSEDSAFNRVFKLTEVDIGCISIGVNGSEQSGVTFDGTICFFKDHPTYGNGVGGKLAVGLPIVDVEMASIFGSKRKADGSKFKYWFVDGKAIFEEGGVTMGSIQLLGLGGGIYWNMELQNAGTDTSKSDPNGNSGAYNQQLVNNAASMQEETTASNPVVPESIDVGFSSLSGFNPIPKDGSKLFKLMIPIASVGDKSIFNMDVSVTVGVTTGMGLTQFSIVGNGYVMAEPTREDRRKAPVNLDVIIDFQKNEEYKLFDATIGVYANIGNEALYVRGVTPMKSYDGVDRFSFVHAQFYVQSYNDKSRKNENIIYFKLGSPNRPGGLKANVADLIQVDIRNYLQIGNHLDDGEFMPLPSLITEVFNKANVGGGGGLQGGNVTGIDRGFPESRGEGFIMGLQAQTNVDIRAFILRVYLQVAFGFDLQMINYGEDATCYGESEKVYDPFGANGWYASGQLYAGIKGKLSLFIDLFFTELEIDLFELGAAFLIQGGFPNPVWAEGKAGIYYRILGGRIKGSANFNFSVGDKCRPPRTDPFGFPIIEAIDPDDKEKGVSPFSNVAATFSIPIDKDFEVPVELGEDGETYIGTEIYKPYIENFTLTSDKNGAIATKPIDRRENNYLAVLTPERVLNNEKVSVNLLVKAWKKESGSYIPAIIPEGDNAGDEWTEQKQVSFTVGEAPNKIPESTVKYTYPVKNQRYFLKDETDWGGRKKGTVHFYRKLGNTYFKTQPTAPNNIRQINGNDYNIAYKYIARFYSLDGLQTIDKPITIRSGGRYIKFDIPNELENERIYNLNIIRKEELTKQSSGTLLTIRQEALNLNDVVVNDNVRERMEEIMNERHKEMYMTAVIQRNAHLLIPGRQDRKGETVLLNIPFRTSKYNTVLEKAQSCTNVVYNGSRNLYYAPDVDVPIEYLSKAIDVTCGEGFDEFDLYGKQTTDGVVDENDRNNTNSHTHNPPFAFSPEVSGTNFWRYKAKKVYEDIQKMNRVRRYERTVEETQWTSLPRQGRVEVKANVLDSHTFEISKLPKLKEYELEPVMTENSNFSLMRFTRFKRGVKPYLAEDELINQASRYVRERYNETSSNTNTQISSVLNTGISLSSANNISNNLLNTGINSNILEALNPNTLTLMYDLHQAVTADALKYKYLFREYNDKVYEVRTGPTRSIISNFTRVQLKEQLGSFYYPIKRSAYSTIFYGADRNPGQYKLRIGKYLGSLRNINSGEMLMPGVVKTFRF